MNNIADIAIIGAGIAGVSAAVYAKRAGMSFFIFESGLIGGQLHFIEKVDNYVGIEAGLPGRDFAEVLNKTLAGLEVEIINERVTVVTQEDKKIILRSENSSYAAKGAIIATGASFKNLGIKGETEFQGRGVSYCAVCDGFFFKGKDVAVIGGGNSAVEEAIYLAGLCRTVTVVHRRDKLRAMDYLQKKLFSTANIKVEFNSVVREIKGQDSVEEAVIESITGHKSGSLSVQGIFIAIGAKPDTEKFSKLVSVDEYGFILTDSEMKTSCETIWACGDCRKRPVRQLITAACEGAVAALSAYKHFKGSYLSI